MTVPRDHSAIGLQYAEDVVAGRVLACAWVKLACQRQLDDLARWGDGSGPYRFDVARGNKAAKFIELLPHIKGPKAGERLLLEPWQCWIITTVFGWLRTDTGHRRFRRVYLEMPRGQGKSALSSGVALYMLAADGEGGAEVYSCATTREQARIVFRDAQHMARKSPDLMRAMGVDVAAHNINVLRTASKFEALSADAHSLDGLNIHLAVIDELHAHKTRDVYDVIETGTGKRPQSLLWCITTAGTDRAGICYEVRGFLTKVLNGAVSDDSQFGVIYSIDDGDEWHSPASWQKANPNWGVSVMPEVIGQLGTKAMQMPSAQVNFRTKHICEWCHSDTAWMDIKAWDRQADPTLDLDDFVSEPCWVGLDLASKTDIAAKIRLFHRQIEGETHYYVFGQYYLPEAAVSDGRNSQYAGWEIEGRLTTTPGDVLDFDQVRQDLIEDSRRFQVEEISYDPWQATQLASQLMADGAKPVEFRNTVGNFSAPMKEIDALVRSGRLHHAADPVLTWMVSNVVCHVDAKENIYPRKERPENKIDGVVALIMALGRSMHGQGSTLDIRAMVG